MNKVTKFINDVKLELAKVAWPTRDELINSTVVVIMSVIIMAVFIGFCDLILSNAVKIILR